MLMRDALRRPYTHEELFVDRYDALLRAALRITEGDRQLAEDLVQDAFIRFTVVRPSLDEVERIDSYFYAMLRNLHTSRVRRNRRAPEVSLSILDFDSLDIGLRALDAAKQLEVRETVRGACEYGCIRRLSSKVGSIFLLRFFHGYLPSEIAKIARVPAAIVDERLLRARREAKLFVHRPEQLAFMGADRPAAAFRLSPPDDDGSEEALVRDLRGRMFKERHVPCQSPRAIRDVYRSDRTEPLSREELAALVCCPVCLDEVNVVLNIPKLESRWPTDTLGPGSRGGAGGTTRAAQRLALARRRARGVFEHRPRELRVLVNGFEIGSHTIGSEPSDLLLSANVGEPVALIELLSEQDICILFLDALPPPDGTVRQKRRVELSDDRHAELEIAFSGSWPTVRASYFDPRGSTNSVVDAVPSADLRRFVPQTSRRPWTAWLFGLRPRPVTVLVGATLIWLLFWTPGADVSAAERIAHAAVRLVSDLFRSSRAPTPAAPRSDLRPPEGIREPPRVPPPAVRAEATATPRLTQERRIGLELRALSQLQRVDAYLGQEVSLGASDASRVDVRAAVDGNERRQALERALASLVQTRLVHADITDLRHAAPPVSATEIRAKTGSRDLVFVRDRFAMFEPLRQYFRRLREYEQDSATSIDDAAIDADVRRFSVRVLEYARRASQHAWALKYLAERFPVIVIEAAPLETQEVWHTVVREHARSYGQEIALLRAALEPIVKSAGLVDNDASDVVGAAAIDTTPELSAWSLIDRLLEAQKAQDAAVQASFAIQTGDASVNLMPTHEFWRLLDGSTSLASTIANCPSCRLGGRTR